MRLDQFILKGGKILRTDARRELSCQVFDGYTLTGGERPCGEPVVAVWDWGTGPLYVCEKHDLNIQTAQEDQLN